VILLDLVPQPAARPLHLACVAGEQGIDHLSADCGRTAHPALALLPVAADEAAAECAYEIDVQLARSSIASAS
jgi:hypothetical protein